MAYKIFVTEDALTDLEIILDYISADNPAAAERFGKALLNHIEILQNFPRIGVQVRKRTSIRKILHSPIRIIIVFTKTNNWSKYCTCGTEREDTHVFRKAALASDH